MNADRALAEAFASIVASIQLTDDEDLSPDIANAILEPVGAIFREMPQEERHALAARLRECAEAEENPVRKEMIREIPDGFGLLD